jgi:hypothetical protein
MKHNDTDYMIDCYGCQYPMHYAFETVRKNETRYHYCVKCYLLRRMKRVGPLEHEPGTVSNGTATMRSRA